MRRLLYGALSLGTVCFLISSARAQPPDRPGPPPERDGGPPPNPLIEAIDTNHDGVLSADEIRAAGESLKKLDRNGDGKLTEDELQPPRGQRRPSAPGRGDRAGPPADRTDGRRPPGPPDRPRDAAEQPEPRRPGDVAQDAPRPGAGRPRPPDAGPRPRGQTGPPSVLPPFVRDELHLTDAQQRQLDELDADVRAKLDRILTDEQKQELERARRRGPGRPPAGEDRAGPPDGRGRGGPPGPAGRPGRPQRPDGEND